MGENGSARVRLPAKAVTSLALAFALFFPTLAAWSYFLALAKESTQVNPLQQAAYLAGKVVQFTFPVVYLVLCREPWPRFVWPRPNGISLGLAFGLLVAGLMLGVYFGILRHSPVLARTPDLIRAKLEQVGMSTPGRYILLSAFIVAAHSLLEEYYWRWFVFGRLRQLLPLAAAVALSSLAFMSHHVVILYVYLPGRFLSAVMPFSLGIALGGAFWAWLYDRAGTLYAPWLSHLLVDAAIFVIGWDLLWPIAG
jgi:membrane protease YdiL (CAAX protease family)